ncbi:TIGR03758 family integrating conjugative element protein [Stenotrophomonas maltophilia]|uniref:TIGR03758 family integrating conjugative element protein n=1 Tax=Stenotrophomonas maltophilia TaxID=40324 RepID=UPI000DF816E1|nr:TIGR03758 family integrating conjugative element protein [Stenotrophomonas maltophilia]EMB2829841.1 TIGR03758 family integrating conjugative element protein [Stenotrophomonas maltophilia]MBH1450961.1 TIGR03758 family integrating conjugative element protein [Stenotrophomonas maltophilia]MBH1566227.1 TIGR03758 family integrating conjugative element protein [Stenotrophomonas maltophilia]MBH1727780.1 TIGR03758 family integrating conjugative element protein [Stenotrophomonas maltophilia]MBK55933
MTAAQQAAFQAHSGFTPAQMAVLVLSLVFAVTLLWGAWAIRTAYTGWAEQRLSNRQFVGVVIRFVALYLVLTFFLLS